MVSPSSHGPSWWLLGQSQWVSGFAFGLLASTVLGPGPVPAGYGHGVFELTDFSAQRALALADWSVGAINQPAMTTSGLKLFLFGHGESLLAERLLLDGTSAASQAFEELFWVIPFPPVQGRNRRIFGCEVVLTYLASVL